MTGRDKSNLVAGGPARHVPVLLNEVLDVLAPRSGSVFIDATFGAGGYSRAILAKGASVVGIDRDPSAIAAGKSLEAASGGRLRLAHGRFGRLDEIAVELDCASPDGVVLDIGVSSMQIDEAERGFSFQKDGPLDMRMSGDGPSAADIVNNAAPKDLTRIIGILGEERNAARVSRAIAERRKARPFLRTLDLAGLIEATLGRKPMERIHPATRTFQALRMFINQELDELAAALVAAERILKEGGRLAVVTFHSLEDRIAKRFFLGRSETSAGSRHLPLAQQNAATFRLEKRNAVTPGEAEMAVNPRARSAKLRYGVRTNCPPRTRDFSFHEAANLAPLARFGQVGGQAGGTSHA